MLILRQDVVAMNLDVIAKDEHFFDTYAYPVFQRHRWSSENFRANLVDLVQFRLDLAMIRVTRARQFLFGVFKEACSKENICSPVEEPTELMPVCAFHYMDFSATVCANEHDVRQLQHVFSVSLAAGKALNKSVRESMKAVEDSIEQTRTLAIRAKEKADEAAKKEQERQVVKAKAIAEKVANTSAKLHGATVVNLATTQSKLWDVSEGMQPLKRYPKEEDFQRSKADVGIAQTPYVIDEVPSLKSIVEEKEIKSNQGIFAVQFHSADSTKRDLCGQFPLVTNRNNYIKEVMNNFMPRNTEFRKMASTKSHNAVSNFMSSVSNVGYTAKCQVGDVLIGSRPT